MPTKPPAIVYSTYRPKRARQRKQSVAIPMRIVTAKPSKNISADLFSESEAFRSQSARAS